MSVPYEPPITLICFHSNPADARWDAQALDFSALKKV